MYATQRLSLRKLENRAKSIISPTVLVATTTLQVTLTSGKSLVVPRFIGHSESLFLRKLGPDYHRSSECNAFTSTPRDIRSAGLSCVGTCRQAQPPLVSKISATRFRTNVWSLLGSIFSHPRTIVESVQNTDLLTEILREFMTFS